MWFEEKNRYNICSSCVLKIELQLEIRTEKVDPSWNCQKYKSEQARKARKTKIEINKNTSKSWNYIYDNINFITNCFINIKFYYYYPLLFIITIIIINIIYEIFLLVIINNNNNNSNNVNINNNCKNNQLY